MSNALPSGQRAIVDFPRFGLPAFAPRWPEVPGRPVLRLGGDAAEPGEVWLEDLSTLPRCEEAADFHCVTTWSRRGLVWSGFRLHDFFERFVVPRAPPRANARCLMFKGLDGYRSGLPFADALAADVLLADRLEGEPLSVEHGAPIRVVAPAHYGYKSVKHLCAVELWTSSRPGSAGWMEHPRGRVALEERGQVLPGWVLRHLYRAMLAPTRWYFHRHAGGWRSAAGGSLGRRT